MKVITSVTVRTGKTVKKGDRDVLQFIELPPGEHDLDDKLARGLVARGQAVTPAEAAKVAKAEAGPSVTKVAKAK